MQYHVVPFTASIVTGQGAEAAAEQLSEMINHYSSQGWEYIRLESVSTIVTNPGNAGCAGFGAVPQSSTETVVYMVVFRRP